ncbi:hypothetical protein IQA49_06425 [Leptospira borgpetersenii serovar Ballum]|uniref:methyltransferase domain-containing protein n=1 Tax=Leptospira borgpetersenii TaxID=174 RepID=UPI0003781BFF|nr:methyltransferase domain-containing protein [Leptospira borgpetersenii]KGE24380.1 hypothetical protein IQ66_08080 [Leptospira borgpetersenii serovar Ballum]MBF3372342.1 hypothetical protein [Leptospira borgpetersenii serovar Arborea]PTM49688.1 hypothetical protein CLV95_102107 [Leptospira borgpetersenii serovar Javanica]AXX16225.1 hypothetical protein C4Q31_12300 [Leptospira borgpetersenii serovar Ceylonica]MBE8159768.1 hypothetical protein [Leptospira borgpetersenii serovar Ballum]
MAWGVVEHVLDSDVFLKRVVGLLVPGGLFVSEVPHAQSLLIDISRKTGLDPKRILMGEQHIVLYSTEAYKSLHERNGFKKIHLQTNGLDMDTPCLESMALRFLINYLHLYKKALMKNFMEIFYEGFGQKTIILYQLITRLNYQRKVSNI